MQRWPRAEKLWLVVVVVAVLLAVLAVLQYRWVGAIGRAERDRMQAALEASARRFEFDLVREAGDLLQAFRLDPGLPPAALAGAVAARFAAWRGSSAHPRLVSGLVLVTRSDSGEPEAAECEPGEPCTSVPFPVELAAVAGRLGADVRGREGPFHDLFLEHPPALLVPIVDLEPREAAPPPRPGDGRPRSLRQTGVLVVRLDPAYLRDELLPRLAEARFGPLAETDASVAILRRSDGAILYSSDPDLRSGEPEPGDVRLDIPGRIGGPVGFRGRPDGPTGGPEGVGPGGEVPRQWRRPGGGSPWGGEPIPDGARLRREPGGSPLVIVVRHRGGSIDETVSALRRRNLGISLGILALLGITSVLLAIGAQRARRLARQQLEFVAGVTHELHTPLAAIRSAGQNLADGIVADPAQVRRYGALLGRESDRLGELVSQVLDFAGIESGARPLALAPVALGPLVEEAVRDLGVVLDRAGLSVEVRVDPDLPDIPADAAALRRALGNLITNAAKFAAEGGLVLVRAERAPDRGRLRLVVEDAGPGVSRAEGERVFEPFVRGAIATRRRVPGSGLGLAYVRHVAETHGGRAWIEARPGGGTVVVMELEEGSSTQARRP